MNPSKPATSDQMKLQTSMVTRIAVVITLCTLGSCKRYENSSPKEPPYGHVHLPEITSFDSEKDFMVALGAIRVDPMTKTHLPDRERQAFLGYGKQVCSVLQVSSLNEIYISENADVWRLLRDNFPQAKEVLAKARKSGPTISVQSVMEGILKLY